MTTSVLHYSKRYLFITSVMILTVACQPKDDLSNTTTTTTPETTQETVLENTTTPPAVQLEPKISQQFRGENEIEQRLARALPEIPYHTEQLSEFAQQVNAYRWQVTLTPDAKTTLEPMAVLKIQALLNWHHHGVGAVDGKFAKNTIKAMQAFQKAHDLPQTTEMDLTTWNALTQNSTLNQQPVLVNYVLTDEDVNIKKAEQSQYHTVQEAIAEKFHMSQYLLKTLNPNVRFKAGQTITVYNPGQPNTESIARLVAHQKLNILYAYNADGKMVASYPTTVGSSSTPSPEGKFRIKNRILNPTYNKDFTNKDSVVSAGPNNPVGRVWLGLDKKGYGIHGSPEPEAISRQASLGCVRLTNWDVLALYGTIQDNAEVELIGKFPTEKSKKKALTP